MPLATVVRARPWLALWARLGVRNEFQTGMARAEVVAVNRRFLLEETNYAGRRRLVGAAERHFSEVRFVEREYLMHTRARARWLRPLVRSVPPVARVYGELRWRVMFLRR